MEKEIREALTTIPYACYDDLYLLAYVWTKQDIKDTKSKQFEAKLNKWLKFLWTHSNPESITRTKREFLSHGQNEIYKSRALSTEDLKNEILHGQKTLFSPIDKEGEIDPEVEEETKSPKQWIEEAKRILA